MGVETLLRELERVLPQGRHFQQEVLPDKDQSMDTSSKEDVKESPPEKSDIEKLQESLQEREEREASLMQAVEIAETKIQRYEAELETVKTELENLKAKVSKDVPKLQASQHKLEKEKEKTPILIHQASKDLQQMLSDEKIQRLEFQESTTNQLAQDRIDIKSVKSEVRLVKSEVKSEVISQTKTHVQAEVPQLQDHMGKMLDATMGQLRGEMEQKLSKVSQRHDEREEVCYYILLCMHNYDIS